MDKKEIMLLLKEWGIQDYKNKAGYIFDRYGSIDRKKLRNMVKDAEALNTIQKTEEKAIATSTTNIYSEDLFNQLLIFIERARLEIFGKSQIPFLNYEDAIKWIDDKSNEYIFSEEIVNKRIKFDEKFNDLCDQVSLGELIGNTTREHRILPYKTEEIDGVTYYISAAFEHSRELRKLQSESLFISKLYHFSQYDIVKLILSGKKPDFVRYDIKKLQGQRTSIVITINTSDLTFDDIKTIYDIYRLELNVKNKKRFNRKQEKLLSLIKEFGERPKDKSFEEYYSLIQSEFNKRHPEEKKYETHQAVYKALEGIKKKLKEMEG